LVQSCNPYSANPGLRFTLGPKDAQRCHRKSTSVCRTAPNSWADTLGKFEDIRDGLGQSGALLDPFGAQGPLEIGEIAR
ncbi:MAG: hypothetical protein ACKOKH_07580, partial [Bacteroidota bacterium]